MRCNWRCAWAGMKPFGSYNSINPWNRFFLLTHFPSLVKLRGIRLHFGKMLKSVKEDSVEKAQLGLGHSYSRAKVKFNVHRADNMIIQAIALLDQLDKDINTFAMRTR